MRKQVQEMKKFPPEFHSQVYSSVSYELVRPQFCSVQELLHSPFGWFQDYFQSLGIKSYPKGFMCNQVFNVIYVLI
jgi:hypothetical protein